MHITIYGFSFSFATTNNSILEEVGELKLWVRSAPGPSHGVSAGNTKAKPNTLFILFNTPAAFSPRTCFFNRVNRVHAPPHISVRSGHVSAIQLDREQLPFGLTPSNASAWTSVNFLAPPTVGFELRQALPFPFGPHAALDFPPGTAPLEGWPGSVRVATSDCEALGPHWLALRAWA